MNIFPVNTSTKLTYLDDSIESTLYRNGKVFTTRDKDGNDGEYQGAALDCRIVTIRDARCYELFAPKQLDVHGFELLHEPLNFSEEQFLDNQRVVENYYLECTEIVKQATKAPYAFAFDHNIRWPSHGQHKIRIAGGQQVQAPIHYVHGDYTLTSAPQRLHALAKQPLSSDTLHSVAWNVNEPLINTGIIDDTLHTGRRFAFINVWRNIDDSSVMSEPLALCDGNSKTNQDLVVFEIHYTNRVGENYFTKYSPKHEWWYYPRMTRDEVLLIKQWDSAGRFALYDGILEDSQFRDSPCTFSFHSAFHDPNTPIDAPLRKSIEVRCVVIFD